MALTLINEPDEVSLAKNPTVFEFSTDNEFSTAGVVHTQDITFTSIPANNDQIVLTWLGGDIEKTLVFKTTPNDSGLELKTQSFATVDQYLEDVLVDELNGVYELFRDFQITFQGSNKIRLTSRFYGAGYEISSSITGSFSGAVTLVQQGVDQVRRPNFRVSGFIDIRYKGEASFGRVPVELIPISSKVIFDFSSILRNYDKLRLTSPERTLPLDISNQIIEFETAFAEAFGTTLDIQKLSGQDRRHALCGGYNLRDSLVTSFYNDELPKFLTSRSILKLYSGMPYFLYYFHSTSSASLVLRGTFNYTDGTSESITIQSFTATENSLWSLPSGWAVLSNLANGAKTLSSVTVFIAASSAVDTPLISSIKINLIQQSTLDQFLIAYRNSYGVLEVTALTGQVSKVLKVSSDKSGIWQRYDANIDSRRSQLIGVEGAVGWEISSGFMNEVEAENFQDILFSDSHFLVTNGTYFPILLEPDDHTIKQSKSFGLNGFTIKVMLDPEKSYSDVGNTIG